MALLSLQQYMDSCTAVSGSTDASVLLENALVAGFALVDVSEGSAMSWALLALIYASGGSKGVSVLALIICTKGVSVQALIICTNKGVVGWVGPHHLHQGGLTSVPHHLQ